MTSSNEKEGGRSGRASSGGLAIVRCFSAPTVVTAAIILFLVSLIVALVMDANIQLTLTGAAALLSLLFFGAELALRSGLADPAAIATETYSSESVEMARRKLFAIVGEQLLAFALTGLIVSAGVIYFTTQSEKDRQLREDRQRFLAYVEEISTNEDGSRRSAQYVGFDLSGMRATDLRIDRVDLTDSVLNDTNFSGSEFIEAEMDGADGDGTSFERTVADRLSLEGAKLDRVSFKEADTEHIDFERAELAHVDFSGADLQYARFDIASLDDVNFSGANLSGATFHGATMESITWDGACWRAEDPPSGADTLPAGSVGEPDDFGFCPTMAEEVES